jgi:hypothetical protein
MKTLEKRFNKNGIEYILLDRTDSVALFELLCDNITVGYEVAKVYINAERIIAGVTISEGESITGNERFGYDGSKSFFQHDRELAVKYFTEFTNKLRDKEHIKRTLFYNT